MTPTDGVSVTNATAVNQGSTHYSRFAPDVNSPKGALQMPDSSYLQEGTDFINTDRMLLQSSHITAGSNIGNSLIATGRNDVSDQITM